MTVPAFVAALATPELVDELTSCGRTVGGATELDLGTVDTQLGTDAADRLASYWSACRRFWNRATTTGRPSGPAVVVLRPLLDARQSTGRDKRDLIDELSALMTVPGLHGQLHELLTEHDPGQVETELWAPRGIWCPTLGGPASIGELRRRFTVDVRYASWRDRPARRLARVQIHAEELWPDPTEV